MSETDIPILLRDVRRHPMQLAICQSAAKRRIVRAGRRGGKTTVAAVIALKAFGERRRVLYAAPTTEQVGKFWFEVTRALQAALDAGHLYKNESEHVIEVPRTEQRIRAKTAWNADTLRGDFADLLILDEYQLMSEDAWGVVGAPMLLDNNGDAVFIYTPVSLRSRSVSKARDKRHAAKLFERAKADASGRWAAFHFTSHENPHISPEALADITGDMTATAYRQEIEAEDIDEAPGALWKRADIEAGRVMIAPDLTTVYVGVDPMGSVEAEGAETGVVVAGRAGEHFYVLDDASLHARPEGWASVVVTAFHRWEANAIIAEKNFGGDMVESTILTVDKAVPVRVVTAARGKAVRAEPVVALYQQGKVHHVGSFPDLEDEMCQWVPGEGASPNRVDALVWAISQMRGARLGMY